MKSSPALNLCWIEALRRAAGQPTPCWLDAVWYPGFRSPWKA